MSRAGTRRDLAIAGVGAVGFLALHTAFELGWESLFQPAALDRPWFMASKSSLIATQVTVGLLACGLALREVASWRRRLWEAALLVFGAMSAVIALFFLIGPGELMVGPTDLWPLSLAAAFFLIAPATLAGTLLGGFLRAARPSRRRGPRDGGRPAEK